MFDIDLALLHSVEAMEFYHAHAHQNIADLLFKYGSDSLKRAWSLQLESRKRAKNKLPTWYNTNAVVFPLKANLEQASSEATATYKASVAPYKTSIDLTGGTGIDSWKIAEKAQNHVFVESNPELVNLAKHNFKLLGLTNVNFINSTAEDFLKNSSTVDLIFIDPSRRIASGKKVLFLEEYSPNVTELQRELLAHAKHVLIKVSPIVDITYLIRLFRDSLKEIHVVAVNNEVKEILVLLVQSWQKPLIKAVNLTNSKPVIFSFSITDESLAPTFANAISTYVYEPNAAVLKSGGFNSVANNFNLQKLDKSSHLYTHMDFIPKFPGKCYKVIETANPYKLKGNYKSLSIISRNFPDKPEMIKKRLKMKDGNEFRLFATTIAGSKKFIVGKEVSNNQ